MVHADTFRKTIRTLCYPKRSPAKLKVSTTPGYINFKFLANDEVWTTKLDDSDQYDNDSVTVDPYELYNRTEKIYGNVSIKVHKSLLIQSNNMRVVIPHNEKIKTLSPRRIKANPILTLDETMLDYVYDKMSVLNIGLVYSSDDFKKFIRFDSNYIVRTAAVSIVIFDTKQQHNYRFTISNNQFNRIVKFSKDLSLSANDNIVQTDNGVFKLIDTPYPDFCGLMKSISRKFSFVVSGEALSQAIDNIVTKDYYDYMFTYSPSANCIHVSDWDNKKSEKVNVTFTRVPRKLEPIVDCTTKVGLSYTVIKRIGAFCKPEDTVVISSGGMYHPITIVTPHNAILISSFLSPPELWPKIKIKKWKQSNYEELLESIRKMPRVW